MSNQITSINNVINNVIINNNNYGSYVIITTRGDNSNGSDYTDGGDNTVGSGIITTSGDNSFGMLIQTISGGGGVSGSITTGDDGVNSNGSDNTDGGIITTTGILSTSGFNSHVVLIQSIGGGGGFGNFLNSNKLSSNNNINKKNATIFFTIESIFKCLTTNINNSKAIDKKDILNCINTCLSKLNS